MGFMDDFRKGANCGSRSDAGKSSRKYRIRNLTAGGGVVAVVLGALSGCSGSVNTIADVPSLARCVDGSLSGYEVSTDLPDPDWFWAEDGIRVIQASSRRQDIQILAAGSEADAGAARGNYEEGGLGQVDQFGTVVVSYSKMATPQESGAIERCLDEQGIG